MRCTGQVIENPVTGDRMIFHRRACDTAGRLIDIEWFLLSNNRAPAHYHTIVNERFEILEGMAAYVLGGVRYTARSGDVVNLPVGQAHVHPWNIGSGTLRLRQQVLCPT